MAEIINNNRPTYENRRRKGTGFTNTQDLVESNKNNKLGESVTSNLQKDINSTNKQISGSMDKFQNEADKTRLSWDEDGQGVENALNQIDEGGEGFSLDTAKNYLDANYKGPKDLDLGESLYNKTKEVSDLAQRGNTEAGRQNLLRRTFGNQNKYTQGQTKFDSMIMGKTAQEDLKGLTRQANEAGKSIENTRNQARNLAQNYATQTKDFVDRYKTEVTGRNRSLQDTLRDRKESNNYGTSAASLARAAQQDTGDIYSGLLNKVGMDTGRTYGYNLGDFQDIQSTLNNVTKQEELNKLNALAHMMGQDQQSYFNVDQDILGQYNNLNNAALLAELQDRQKQFEVQRDVAESAQIGDLSGVHGKMNNVNYEQLRNALNDRDFNLVSTNDYSTNPELKAYSALSQFGFDGNGMSKNDINMLANMGSNGLSNLNNERTKLKGYITDDKLYNTSTDYQSLLDKYAGGRLNNELDKNIQANLNEGYQGPLNILKTNIRPSFETAERQAEESWNYEDQNDRGQW